MESLIIQVSPSTHGRLRELANKTGDTMTDIVDRAVQDYLKRRFWADYQAAHAAIQADPAAKVAFQDEVESWDSTMLDGPEETSIGSDAGAGPVPG